METEYFTLKQKNIILEEENLKNRINLSKAERLLKDV